MSGEQLFNLGFLEPPLVVMGVRGGLRATDAPAGEELPEDYLYYLGGSSDVRGFRRLSIPGDGIGARSAGYLGAETRLVSVIPYGIEPFVFLDSGKIGESAYSFSRPTFYSPGAGVRWQSPFGSLRGSLARGIVSNADDDPYGAMKPAWTAFVSFGEEF